MTAVVEARAPAPAPDRPNRSPFPVDAVLELASAAVSGFALVFFVFRLQGWTGPAGFTVCWFLVFVAVLGVLVRQRHGLLEAKDRLATVLIWAGALCALVPLFLIIGFVLVKGLEVVLQSFPKFLTQDLGGYRPSDPISEAGMKHAIIGSLLQVAIATAITVPIGILAATYLNEVGGRFAGIVRAVADAMTGLPTIIAGLVIYSAWVKPRGLTGQSGFAAALALAIVMLPTVVRTAEEVLRIVSGNLREAALALGAPEWKMVLRIVVPTARAGLVTAAILGVARAVGETAPVLFTAFGSPITNVNPFEGAQADLPISIYTAVKSDNQPLAWGGALLLVLIVLTLFSLARILGTGGPGGRRPGRGRRFRRRAPAPAPPEPDLTAASTGPYVVPAEPAPAAPPPATYAPGAPPPPLEGTRP